MIKKIPDTYTRVYIGDFGARDSQEVHVARLEGVESIADLLAFLSNLPGDAVGRYDRAERALTFTKTTPERPATE